MLLSLVMIQGELDEGEIAALYTQVGYRECEAVGEPVPGIAVLSLVEEARPVRPQCEFLRHCVDQGWTVLSDESGNLALARNELWTSLARQRGTRVVVLHGEPDPGMRAFALHERDGSRRAVAQCEDERHEIGRPLAIEAAFAHRPLTVDDLVLIVQSLGIDFERLNVLPLYTVMSARPALALAV